MKNSNPGLIISALTVLTLVMCVCTFSLLTTHGEINIGKMMVSLLIDIPTALLLVWADYYIISHVNRKIIGHAKKIITGILFTTALIVFVVAIVFSLTNTLSDTRLLFSTSLLPAIVWNLTMTLGIELFFYYREQAATANKLAFLKKEQAEYKFRRLKEQINPHFLFNCLNNIAALTYEDADKANRFAKKMSSVYRYILLTQYKPTVELKEELLFVDSYLYLESIRFDGMLQVERHYAELPVNAQVIPASIQMLVENAIKHNVNTKESPLRIVIDLGKDGVTVSNNIQLRPQIRGNGVGLSNLKKQYELFEREMRINNDGKQFSVFLPFIFDHNNARHN